MINLCAPSRILLPFLLGALVAASSAWAESAGTVTNLSGTLADLKADGTSRLLSIQSKIDAGDTLSTQQGTYARLQFRDGGEVVLRPNTIFRVNNYHFQQEKPKADSFFVSLLKGGARFVSGLIGHRGDKDAYSLKTPAATIGIRGTDYSVLTCQGDCSDLPDGTYTNTHSGSIFQSNHQGSLDCAAGQSCFSAPGAKPVFLPNVPKGLNFNPPPSFLDKINGEAVLDMAGHKECVVR
jgi:hypothetical protein